MKVIITKYALSEGPTLEEVEETKFKGMVATRGQFNQCYHGEFKEWHKDKESARNRIYAMVESRRNTLEKSLRALESKKDKALRMLQAINLE